MWTWLSIVKRGSANVPLPSEAEAELQRLQGVHPQWQLTDWQADGFVSWSYGAGLVDQPTEISAQELIAKSPHEIVALITKSNLNVPREVWRQATSQDPKLAASVLTDLSKNDIYPEHAWIGALQALPQFDSEERCAVLNVLNHAPEQLMTQVMRQLAMWFSTRAQDFSHDDEKYLWPVWDRLRAFAENVNGTTVGGSAITAAINHPFGNLAEALIKRFWAASPEPNQGLGDLASRFTAITSSEGKGAWYGRVVLATALHPLFVVDPAWTTTNLLPRFDWTQSDEAPLVWDGYLHSPRLSVTLLERVKPQLLEAFKRIDNLRNWSNLCALLAAIGLEGSGELSNDETREAIRAMQAKGRRELTAWIVRRMRPSKATSDNAKAEDQPPENEKETRHRFFAARVIPWLTSVWPPESDSVDGKIAANLAIASIWAGEAYPQAVKHLRFFWKKTDEIDILLRELKASEQGRRFPDDTLQLLNLLLQDDLPFFAGKELREILSQIESADPHVHQATGYTSLRDCVLRAGG